MEFYPVNDLEIEGLSSTELALFASLWTNSWTSESELDLPNWRTLMLSLVNKGLVQWRNA